jgi:SAM-dependent methyltransferase
MSDRLRLLVAIASYGTGNDRYLARLVAEYQSMPCDVSIIVLSNIAKPVEPGVELHVGLPTPDPWSLPFGHQRIFADRRNDYDLFLYSEDDVLVTWRNIEAFLRVQAVLPPDEIAGFVRYEEGAGGKLNYPDVHGCYHWDPASVHRRGPYTFAFLTNEHAACYLLTREQLSRSIASGGYLVDAHEGRYDLLCTAATDPYTQCGFRKVVCVSHFHEFAVHHLPNKYVGTPFGISEAELQRQLQVLLKAGREESLPLSLLEAETKLKRSEYSKSYYEPVRPEVLSAIPGGVGSLLSLGCGSGSTERHLLAEGLRVTALPLDPVISSDAAAAGVEMITGDFTTARRRLADRKFDCLLVSNVLHLLPDPVAVLGSFASVLSEGGAAIAITPNMARLSVAWKALRGRAAFTVRDPYEKTGIHRVSHRVLERWFRSAGMKITRIEKIVAARPKRPGKVDWIVRRLPKSWLAEEFVVVATKRAA